MEKDKPLNIPINCDEEHVTFKRANILSNV